MEVSIPPDTTATVLVPDREIARMPESGRPIAEAQGAKFVRMDPAFAVFEIGSGEYKFCSD